MNKLKHISFLLLHIVVAPLLLSAQNSSVSHVEPPNWWVGMNNTALQLMLYGENIGDLEVLVDDENITVDKINRVDNFNYLFVDLTIDPKTLPGAFVIRLVNSNNYNVAIFTYNLSARRPGSAERLGFTNADVLYLITPDRFANGDPENDNHPEMLEKVNRSLPGGRHGGDIKGIADHLDYLADIGYTAVWVNPVLENNMETYSYHGYSTTDFYKVDPRFGTNEDYKNLSAKASEKGIKMVMDMIVNHCGSEHWWMKDLPSKDWINFDNKFVQTNHRKPVIQDPHRSEYDYKRMVDGWFVETMPDMNQRNPFLATYLIQNAIWWIEYADLAGIRMDTYPYAYRDFMTQWTCAVMAEYPNFNVTGEEWSENPSIVAYWQQGKVNPDGYTSCLPSLIDFPLRSALQASLTWSGFDALYNTQANDFIYADANKLVVFADNHDMDRFFTQVGEDLGLFKLGMAQVLTTRGTPQIYYGTELLFTNATSDHGLIRKDYPGGWQGDANNAFTNEGLSDKQIEARAFMTTLLNWRKTAKVIHEGKLLHFAPEKGMYIYFRINDTEIVMVVLNKNEQDTQLNLSRFNEVLESVNTGTNIMTGESIAFNSQILVAGKTPLIISIKK